ncbi:hypothetical protein L7F22_045194 [Adiantum nelumboides]|nr:hypothetical protein [Adiantum nelumboides]
MWSTPSPPCPCRCTLPALGASSTLFTLAPHHIFMELAYFCYTQLLWHLMLIWTIVFARSCWAFSATTRAIEGANAIAIGSLVSVSEEELVACSSESGCDGGLMDDAFKWIIDSGGIATKDNYPYLSYSGSATACDTKLEEQQKTVTIDSFADVQPCNEAALLKSIEKQPVSIAIEAFASSMLRVCTTAPAQATLMISTMVCYFFVNALRMV